MRTVELVLTTEFLNKLSQAGVGPIDPRVSDAIGYLSMWGLSGKAVKVRIVGDRRGEMTAVYMDKDGNGVYTIGAVPDDNWKWSFHS